MKKIMLYKVQCLSIKRVLKTKDANSIIKVNVHETYLSINLNNSIFIVQNDRL